MHYKFPNAVYNDKYDAYYDPKTGKWLEDFCGGVNCEFCSKRPSWATPTTDDNINERIESWHSENFFSNKEKDDIPLIEYLGLTMEKYSHWVKTNKINDEETKSDIVLCYRCGWKGKISEVEHVDGTWCPQCPEHKDDRASLTKVKGDTK